MIVEFIKCVMCQIILNDATGNGGYFSSLEKLRGEYEKDIDIFIGFESEYLPELMEEQDAFLKDYPVDYMILGQHFLDSESDFNYSDVWQMMKTD